MKKRHFYYYRDWCVFPLAVEYNSRLAEYMKPTSRLCIHFLWWHWRWDFERKSW